MLPRDEMTAPSEGGFPSEEARAVHSTPVEFNHYKPRSDHPEIPIQEALVVRVPMYLLPAPLIVIPMYWACLSRMATPAMSLLHTTSKIHYSAF